MKKKWLLPLAALIGCAVIALVIAQLPEQLPDIGPPPPDNPSQAGTLDDAAAESEKLLQETQKLQRMPGF